VSSPTLEIRYRPLGRGTFIGGIFATAAVHALIFGMVYISHQASPAPREVVHDVMITRLVHLGNPRPKFQLPRIVEPPKPTAPAPTIKIADSPTAKPAKKEAPRPPDPVPAKDLKRAMDRARALARNLPEEPPVGELGGSEHGTATEASAGDVYLTQVSEAIRSHWTVPSGLSVGDVVNLETEIRVSIGRDGTLGPPVVRHGSGNPLYDASCLQAIQATRQVPPPPPHFRRDVLLVLGGKDLAR
jgi:outer membrane biosynthesis protein TonB